MVFVPDCEAPGASDWLRFESQIDDCEVIGKIPQELDGAFVRVVTEGLHPPRFAHDPNFNAGGPVSMLRFKNGSVDFRERCVRTARWERHRAAKCQRFGRYRSPFTDDSNIRSAMIKRAVLRNVANTNIIAHAGKLWAWIETPRGLTSTRSHARPGACDAWRRVGKGAVAAHLEIDPLTREMGGFGDEATGLVSNVIFRCPLDPAGRVTREARFKTPYLSRVHDIAIRRGHIIIPAFGCKTSLERLREGKSHWAWSARLPTSIGILPRDASAWEPRGFKGPLRELARTFNVRCIGNRLISGSPIGEANPLAFFSAEPGNEDPPTAQRGGSLRRHVFDLDASRETFTEERLDRHSSGAWAASTIGVCRSRTDGGSPSGSIQTGGSRERGGTISVGACTTATRARSAPTSRVPCIL